MLRKCNFLKVSKLITKLGFLNIIGVSCKVSQTAVKDVKKFIQTVCYSGKEEVSLTETRVQLYSQILKKTLVNVAST